MIEIKTWELMVATRCKQICLWMKVHNWYTAAHKIYNLNGNNHGTTLLAITSTSYNTENWGNDAQCDGEGQCSMLALCSSLWPHRHKHTLSLSGRWKSGPHFHHLPLRRVTPLARLPYSNTIAALVSSTVSIPFYRSSTEWRALLLSADRPKLPLAPQI